MILFGGIEAGGTKFICAIGSGPSELQDEIRFEAHGSGGGLVPAPAGAL